MQYLTIIILIFSCLAALDRITGNHFGLGKEYERAFMLLGTMALSMIGMIVISPLIAELMKPGRDPRDELPKPILRTDVLEIDDLKEGMTLDGTVRNVIDFGAFVDIGVHQDGLVHISEISDRYIKHPTEVLKVGDIVKVRVIDINMDKKRITLSMKQV